MGDRPTLKTAFSGLTYTTHLNQHAAMVNNVPTNIFSLPELKKNSEAPSVVCTSFLYPEIKATVQTDNETCITSIISRANAVSPTIDGMINFYTDLYKVFSSSLKTVFYAEAVANGRPINELEKVEERKILNLIKEEITFYQLRKLDDVELHSISTQVFGETGDIALLIQRIFFCLRKGSVIVTCPADSTRVFSIFRLVELFLLAKSTEGLISFIPISRSVSLPNITKIDCINHDNSLFDANPLINSLNIYSDNGISCAVILENADITLAAEACLDSMIYCSGMTPLSPRVILVQEPVFEVFRSCLCKLLLNVTCEDPINTNCKMGPLPTEESFKILKAHIATAMEKEGVIRQPDNFKRFESEVNFGLNPFMLLGIQSASPFFQSSVKGPYTCLIPFRTLKEAVSVANKLGDEKELLLIWSEMFSQAMEAVGLFQYKTIAVNCSSLELNIPSARLSRNVIIQVGPDKQIDSTEVISVEKLQASFINASKAQSTWSRQNPVNRNIYLQQWTQSINSLKDSKFIKSLHLKLFCFLNNSCCLAATFGRKSLRTFQAIGVILVILPDDVVLNDYLFSLLVVALSAGNSIVVTGPQKIKSAVNHWLASLPSNIIKDAITFLFGDLNLATLESTLKVRSIDLIFGFGLTGFGSKLLSVLCNAASSSVVIRESIDTLFNSVFSVEKVLNIMCQEQHIVFSSGDIFAN